MRKIMDQVVGFAHRLKNTESSIAMPVDLLTLKKGDVFVREGAPCMFTEFNEGQAMIVNLVTGSVWHASTQEQVWPCFEVELLYKTARREG